MVYIGTLPLPHKTDPARTTGLGGLRTALGECPEPQARRRLDVGLTRTTGRGDSSGSSGAIHHQSLVSLARTTGSRDGRRRKHSASAAPLSEDNSPARATGVGRNHYATVGNTYNSCGLTVRSGAGTRLPDRGEHTPDMTSHGSRWPQGSADWSKRNDVTSPNRSTMRDNYWRKRYMYSA